MWICTHCNYKNEETDHVCAYCDTKRIPSTAASASPPVRPSNIDSSKNGDKSQKNSLFNSYLVPCDGEEIVRQYHCTQFRSKILGIEADGIMAVSNRRVIFHASGTSTSGNSVILSELPIADVSGITAYKGTFFSFKHILFAIFVSLLASSIVSGVLAALSMLDTTFGTILGWLCGIGLGAAALVYKPETSRISLLGSIMGSCALSSFSVIVGSSLVSLFNPFANRGSTFGKLLAVLFMLSAFIVWVITLIRYAKRETMSIMIGSRAGASKPIAIAGMSRMGIADSAAPKALLEAEPLPDMGRMIKELGALILDIQTLGEHGITKWKG